MSLLKDASLVPDKKTLKNQEITKRKHLIGLKWLLLAQPLRIRTSFCADLEGLHKRMGQFKGLPQLINRSFYTWIQGELLAMK